jgi:hypothetical protein
MSNLKRINVLYTGFAGLPGTNTLYAHENGISAADQVAAVLAFYTGLASAFRSGLHIAVDSVVEIVDSTNGQTTGLDDTGAGGTVTGSNSGALLPPSTQLLVRWRTGVFFSGRELRGRTFLPYFTENDNSSGAPSSGLVASVQTAAQTMADDANLAVFSPTKFQWADVSAAQVWNEWAVLRSRRD